MKLRRASQVGTFDCLQLELLKGLLDAHAWNSSVREPLRNASESFSRNLQRWVGQIPQELLHFSKKFFEGVQKHSSNRNETMLPNLILVNFGFDLPCLSCPLWWRFCPKKQMLGHFANVPRSSVVKPKKKIWDEISAVRRKTLPFPRSITFSDVLWQ